MIKSKPKQKTCCVCKEKFTPRFSTLEVTCDTYDCKKAYSAQKKNKPTSIKFTPIPKVSKKRKIENLQYQVLRKQFLEKPDNRTCPITGLPTTDIHHKKGRTGTLFLNTDYWIALSREGHKQVEENPQWAKENGYSLNRL